MNFHAASVVVWISVLQGIFPIEGYFNWSNIRLLTYTTPNTLLLTGLPFTGPALAIALEEVKKQYGLNLSNTIITRQDLVTCDDMVANTYLVPEYIYRHSNDGEYFILVNPGCDDEIPLTRLSKEWNIPILTSGTTYPQFYNVAEFPTTISFGVVDYKQLIQGLFDVFEYFAWTSVAVIHDVSKLNSVYPGLVRFLSQNPVKISNFIFFPIDTNSNKTIPYRKVLNGVWPVSRVILLLMMAEPARSFMITAQKMGRAGGEYVYMCAEPFQSLRRFGNLTWQKGDDDDEIAKIAFRSLLHLTGSCVIHGNNSEQAVMDKIKTDGIAQYNAPFLKNEETSLVAMASYYSIKALGEVLSEVTTDSSGLHQGRDFASRFRNRTFVFNNRNIIMSPNGVRVMEYCFRDMDMQSGTLEPVLSYDAMTHKFRPIGNRTVDWGTPGNIPPPNEPKCGFSGNNPLCANNSYLNRALTVSVTSAFLVVFVFSLMTTVRFLHFRKEAEGGKWWRLQLIDMTFEKGRKYSVAQHLTTNVETDRIAVWNTPISLI